MRLTRARGQRDGSCRVWRPGNTPIRARSALLTALAGLIGFSGQSQDASPPAPPAVPEAVATIPGVPGVPEVPEVPGVPGVPGLDYSHGLLLQQQAERWLEGGGVPGDHGRSAVVSGAAGLRVTLRVEGRTLGSAEAWHRALPGVLAQPPAGASPDQPVSLPPADLMRWLEEACVEAFREVEGKLRDRTERLKLDPTLNVGDVRAALSELADRICVDVQIAHAPQRVQLPADAPPAALFAQVLPGYHGWLVPRSAQAAQGEPFGVVWPGTAIATNASPTGQAQRALTDAGYEALEALDRLARPSGPALYRFTIEHAVRPRAGRPPVALTRGNVPLPRHGVQTRTLDDMADRLARHLASRYIGNGLMRGTYQPSRGDYYPSMADDLEAALGCWALRSHAHQERERNAPANAIEAYEGKAIAMADALASRWADATPTGTSDLATVALLVLTLTEPPGMPDEQGRLTRLTERLMQSLDEQGWPGYTQDAARHELGVTPAAQVALALGRYGLHADDAKALAAADAILQQCWDRTQGRLNSAQLPWLAWFDDRVGPALIERGMLAKDAWQTRRKLLADGLDALSDAQVVEPPRLGPDDVLGGFDLRGRDPALDAPPSPDWTTAMPLAYLAVTLRDAERFTRFEERVGPIITAQFAARFLHQLMMDTTSGYAAVGLDNALGGVRLSLWDNRLTLTASAMSLLAINELRHTLDALSQEPVAAP